MGQSNAILRSNRLGILVAVCLLAAWSTTANAQEKLALPEFVISEFSDGFDEESRDNYVLSKAVTSDAGRLHLPPKATLKKNLQAGPVLEATVEFTFSQLQENGERSATEIAVVLHNGAEIGTVIERKHESGSTQGLVRTYWKDVDVGLFGILGVGSEQTLLKFPNQLPDQWRCSIEFRYGQIRILDEKQQLVAAGYVPFAFSDIKSLIIRQKSAPVSLDSLHLRFQQPAWAAGVDPDQVRDEVGNDAVVPYLLLERGEYRQAMQAQEEIIETFDRRLGSGHPWHVAWRGYRASSLHFLGQLKAARQLDLENLAALTQTVGPHHPLYAECCDRIGQVHRELSDFAAAETAHRTALRIYQESLGPESPEAITCGFNIGLLMREMGNYPAAKERLDSAVALYRKTGTFEERAKWEALNEQGNLFTSMGHFEAAEASFRDALESVVSTQGEGHPETAPILLNIGEVCRQRGMYHEADPILRRARDTLVKTLPPNHRLHIQGMLMSATLHASMGDLKRSEGEFREALDLQERVFGKAHPDYVLLLNNLATVLSRQGQVEEAITLLEEVKSLSDGIWGEDHPTHSIVLENLGELHVRLGDLVEGERCLSEAMQVCRNTLPMEHVNVASVISNEAVLRIEQGDVPRAEAALTSAATMLNRLVGDGHPQYLQTMKLLAKLHLMQGDFEKAELVLDTVFEKERWFLDVTATAQSERQQLATQASLRETLDVYLTLCQRHALPAKAVYGHIADWKGTVTARQLELRRLARDGTDPQLRQKLQDVSAELAAHSWRTPDSTQLANWLQETRRLTDLREQLELESARTLPPGTAAVVSEHLDIGEQLPLHSALVDYVCVTASSELSRKNEGTKDDRFLAFVVRRNRDPIQVDLGPADVIREAASGWRAELQQGFPAHSESGLALRNLIWNPLEKHLDGVIQIWISPEDQLSQIPFAAIPGKEPTELLIDRYAIASISSARLLTALLDDSNPESVDRPSLLLLGDVDFDHGDSGGAVPSKRPTLNLATRTAAITGERQHYPPLPGTVEELIAIEQLFQKALPNGEIHTLRGNSATEAGVRDYTRARRYLHLATHGFFASPMDNSAGGSDGALPAFHGFFKDQADVVGFHPDLQSGVVLAGVNNPQQLSGRQVGIPDDGILTAMEVAALQLNDADLVVLSACETGLGEQLAGEGVLGLQRAFHIAGAKSVVASLWKVDDTATQVLMTEFYKNLWEKKLGRLEALRQAQLSMIHHFDPKTGQLRGEVKPLKAPSAETRKQTTQSNLDVQLSPFYWAPFQLSGNVN